MEDDFIELQIKILQKTDKAVLVEFVGDAEAGIQTWLPKSQIEGLDEDKEGPQTIEIPEWLYESKIEELL